MNARDEQGRPLCEAKAPAELRRDVPMELRGCPYRGSRQKHSLPMNISALRQMNDVWSDVRHGLAYMRRLYQNARGVTGPLRYVDVWRVGRMAAALPDFLLLRREGALHDGALPAYVAAIYKVVLGANSSIFAMCEAGSPVTFDERARAEVIFEFVERTGLLVGENQVCAGSEPMIHDLLSVLVDGLPGAREHARTEALLVSPRAFVELAEDVGTLRLLRAAYERADAASARALRARLGEATGDGKLELPWMRDVERALEHAPRGARRLIPHLAGPGGPTGRGRDAVRRAAPGADPCVVDMAAAWLGTERAYGRAVAALKRRIARSLGVVDDARAEALSLTTFEPIEPVAMRTLLAQRLGVAVDVPRFTVTRRAPSVRAVASLARH